MEQYVYLSIVFFSLIIFFLYMYIIYEKLIGNYRNKCIMKYSEELMPYIDFVIDRIENGEEISDSTMKNLKSACKNKYKREIIEDRFLHNFEIFKGGVLLSLVELCQSIGIVEYEIEKLKNKNYLKKALAAKRLGEFRSWKSTKSLLNELNSANSDIKYNILLALAKIGDEESFINAFKNIDSDVILSERSLIEIADSFEGDKSRIYKYMINSDNSFIACVFIKSAGNYKDVSLSHEIAKYLSNENKELRIASAKAIGSLCNKNYLDTMIKLLEDSEWEVRAVTARALGNFNDSRILIPLAKALSDPQWYVRYNAATSILNHSEGINVVSYVFQGEDKFAKDIIISAIENSSNNTLYLYDTSTDPEKKALAMKIREYITMKNKESAV